MEKDKHTLKINLDLGVQWLLKHEVPALPGARKFRMSVGGETFEMVLDHRPEPCPHAGSLPEDPRAASNQEVLLAVARAFLGSLVEYPEREPDLARGWEEYRRHLLETHGAVLVPSWTSMSGDQREAFAAGVRACFAGPGAEKQDWKTQDARGEEEKSGGAEVAEGRRDEGDGDKGAAGGAVPGVRGSIKDLRGGRVGAGVRACGAEGRGGEEPPGCGCCQAGPVEKTQRQRRGDSRELQAGLSLHRGEYCPARGASSRAAGGGIHPARVHREGLRWENPARGYRDSAKDVCPGRLGGQECPRSSRGEARSSPAFSTGGILDRTGQPKPHAERADHDGGGAE